MALPRSSELVGPRGRVAATASLATKSPFLANSLSG
jgi:hypothetical protein